MATKNDNQLDLALPSAILELGQAFAAVHAGIRVSYRPGVQQPTAEQMDALVDKVLGLVRANPTARRLIGIRERGQDEPERRVRMRAFAMLAFQSLGQPASHLASEISDVAYASMDKKLPPGEAILRARHVIGKMVAAEQVAGGMDGDGVCTKARLPSRALEWLSGGRGSLGFLTANKLVGIMLPGIDDAGETPDAGPPEGGPIPSAKRLRAMIAEKVISLDEQAKALSSLLVMHLARGKMLRDGRDPGTGNQATLLIGNSGCGKTWLMEVAAKAAGCPFASMSATAMTSEAYIGGKLDDLFKALVTKAKGDVKAARFGIAFADEWDKKAFRHGRDVTTLAVQQEVLVPMQGAEFLISGKRSIERPVMFDSRGTFFAFAGAFNGLSEMVRKKTSKSCIGFSDGARTRRQEYVIDSIRDYGYVREWVNRLTAVMFLPDPCLGSLERGAAGGVLDSFNALVGELGIVLFPHDGATTRMAEYALESRTFYRGIKSVWWSIAESAVAGGEKGTVLVGAAEVEAAIAKMSSGSAKGTGGGKPALQEDSFDAQADAGAESDGAE